MKTAKFADMVEKAGRPEVHLMLEEPTKDRGFQKAVKAKRVLTVFQTLVGQKKDHAEVGFQEGKSRQYLVFPKSLGAFAGKRIVALNYDLVGDPPVARRPAKAKKAAVKKKPEKVSKPPADKVVAFKAPEQEDEEEDAEVAALKRKVRRAMALLEEGKQVAAFEVLKGVVR